MMLVSNVKKFYFFPVGVRQFTKTHRLNSEDTAINVCKSWRIIFYGTDRLSEASLRALNLNRITDESCKIVKSLDVVCIKQDCPVRKYAESCGIPIYTWPHAVPPNYYDVGIVVSFGHLIPTKSILACKHGMINAHPSILPRWRGAAPIIHSVLNGDAETGVTIIQVAPKKFDVGKVLMQKKCLIPEKCTSELLTTVLSKIAAEMVLNVLKNLTNYLENAYSQSEDGITYAKKISPDMGLINWPLSTMRDIDRKFRALKGCIKIYTHWKTIRVVLLDFIEPEEAIDANIDSLVTDQVLPGFCYYHKKRKTLFVKCQDGWIGITMISIPVRGTITSRDFYNGFMTKIKPNECYFNSDLPIM